MRTLAKSGAVVLGYVAAWLIAEQVLALHRRLTASDSQGADGMYAFGDGLLFLGTFVLMALVPTGAVAYFLRTSRSFWSGLAIVALVLGATAPLAAVLLAASHWSVPGGWLAILSGLAVPRLMLSPLFSPFFCLCGALAPAAPSRKKLFMAGGLEALALGCIVLFWFFTRR